MTVPVQENAVSEDSLVIPLIDFGAFLKGTEEERLAVGRAVAEGFRNAGFIYLKNHGIPAEAISEVFAHSAAFFARPMEQKEALGWSSPEANRGYSAPGREKTTSLTDKEAVSALRSQNPDLKESIEIGRDDEPQHPNMWPDRFDAAGGEFRATMTGFFATCQQLHMEVMRAIALGMGLAGDFFDRFCNAADNTLRLLHYPPTAADVFRRNVGQVRAGRHSDYGSITLLFQDARGGLQVRSPRGSFVNASPIDGTIVVNAGDLLARWSNDRIRSTEHQVVEPPSAPGPDGMHPARYSCAYFCNPNFDAHIEALPGTYGKDEEKKYAGVNSGEYLVQRLADTYA